MKPIYIAVDSECSEHTTCTCARLAPNKLALVWERRSGEWLSHRWVRRGLYSTGLSGTLPERMGEMKALTFLCESACVHAP